MIKNYENYESSLKGEMICKEIVKTSFEVRTPGKSKEDVAAGMTRELRKRNTFGWVVVSLVLDILSCNACGLPGEEIIRTEPRKKGKALRMHICLCKSRNGSWRTREQDKPKA